MKLPIYKLRINPNDIDSGVDYVALVDNPAIERNWMTFDAVSKLSFKIADKEKQVVAGPLMIADMPIYRRDADGREFYVIFEKDTIEQIVHKFYREKLTDKVNVMHDKNMDIKKAYMFGSYIIDREHGIEPPKGYEDLTDGSWFGFYKIDDTVLWEDFIKTGVFKGFSVEGAFQPVSKDDELKAKLVAILQNIEL